MAGEKIDGTRTWDTWVAAAVDSHNQKDGDEARLDCPGHRVLIDLLYRGREEKGHEGTNEEGKRVYIVSSELMGNGDLLAKDS